MRLKSIQYSEHEVQPNPWRLEGCTLGDINLIVGKNATGKTRTLSVISELANLLSGDSNAPPVYENWDAIFDNDAGEIHYRIEAGDNRVVLEELTQSGKMLLQRGANGIGKIYAEKLGQELEFQPPVEELAVVSRRDALQHSFLGLLHRWAKAVQHFRFGTPMGQDIPVALGGGSRDKTRNSRDLSDPVSIFKKGEEEYKAEYVQQIIDDMERIGYELEHIFTDIMFQSGENFSRLQVVDALYIKEKELVQEVPQREISQGMFRALSLIIQVNYSLLASSPSCILIDDIGEGLDFSRSAALIDLLIEKVKGTQVQLIMATNNRFVMNRVPLEYWSVIRRVPNGAKIYNYRNSKAIFDDFEFTGLSNFDFFSSDYLENALLHESEFAKIREDSRIKIGAMKTRR